MGVLVQVESLLIPIDRAREERRCYYDYCLISSGNLNLFFLCLLSRSYD